MEPISPKILDELAKGRRTVEELGASIGREKQNVYASLSLLAKKGKVIKVARSTYEIGTEATIAKAAKNAGKATTKAPKVAAAKPVAVKRPSVQREVKQKLEMDARISAAAAVLFPNGQQPNWDAFLTWVDCTREMFRG